MLFNKKWIYVLKRISNGAHKNYFHVVFLRFSLRLSPARMLLGIFDSVCTLFIGFRHSSLSSQRKKRGKHYEELHNVKLAYKLQCIDSCQWFIGVERNIPIFLLVSAPPPTT